MSISNYIYIITIYKANIPIDDMTSLLIHRRIFLPWWYHISQLLLVLNPRGEHYLGRYCIYGVGGKKNTLER